MFFVLLSSQATALIDYHIFCRLSTTFLFFLFRFCNFINHFQATAYLLYHIRQPFVKNFFQVFSLHFSSYTFHIPPGLSSVFYFASVVLATKTILSFLFVIVNVFLVFYLFRTIQTIHAILTKKLFSSCCSLPCQSLRWLARRMHVLSWTASRPSPKAI